MNTGLLESIQRLVIFLALTYLCILVVMISLRFRRDKKNSTKQFAILNEQAQKRNGIVVKQGMFIAFPQLEFEHNTHHIQIQSQPKKKYSALKTIFKTDIYKSSDRNFMVYQKTALSGVARTLGMQDIIIGSKRFDDQYVIQGDDSDFLKTLLDDDVCQRILALPLKGFVLKFQKGGFKLSVSQFIEDEHTYNNFVQLALDIVDRTI